MSDKALNDQTIVWYGPHHCAECGVTIVKASREQGGAEFEPPDRLMRIYYRGAESSDPSLLYPMTWAPHVHRVPPVGPVAPPPNLIPMTEPGCGLREDPVDRIV